MLMPTGGIFSLLPACYYKAEYFMLLTVMSQQGAHPWEQDHASVSNSIAVSICHVRQELLTELFSMSLFNNVKIAARNVIYNSISFSLQEQQNLVYVKFEHLSPRHSKLNFSRTLKSKYILYRFIQAEIANPAGRIKVFPHASPQG